MNAEVVNILQRDLGLTDEAAFLALHDQSKALERDRHEIMSALSELDEKRRIVREQISALLGRYPE